jgi:hypothetical protein
MEQPRAGAARGCVLSSRGSGTSGLSPGVRIHDFQFARKPHTRLNLTSLMGTGLDLARDALKAGEPRAVAARGSRPGLALVHHLPKDVPAFHPAYAPAVAGLAGCVVPAYLIPPCPPSTGFHAAYGRQSVTHLHCASPLFSLSARVCLVHVHPRLPSVGAPCRCAFVTPNLVPG